MMFIRRSVAVVYVRPQGLSSAFSASLRRFSSDFPAHTKIILPALSPTMTEGGLAKWKKKEGESIKPGEVLCEIETDKATVDFEFQEDGTVAKFLVDEGTTGLKVGTVIGIMVDDAASVKAFANSTFADFNAAASAAPAPEKEKEPAKESKEKPQATVDVEKKADKSADSTGSSETKVSPKSSPSSSSKSSSSSSSSSSKGEEGGRVFASPLARRLAREQNKNLSSIKGSGPNGRIVAADVHEAKEGASSSSKSSSPGDSSWTLNKLNTPHYYLNVDVDLTEVLAACDYLNKARKDKVPITVNEFVIRAAALSMRKVPEANAAWGDSGSFRMYDFCDLNVSISDENGIIRSPLIKGIHTAGMEEIASQLKSIEEKLSKGEEADETPGTFSFINVGSFGVKSIVPIVRPGQSTALGLGAMRKSLVPSETSTGAKVTTVATATLSCDHRVVDGAIGAEWLHAFKLLLEKPMSMLL